VDQILPGTQVSLGRLHRCVAQQHLDLLQLPTGRPAQLRTGAATIVRRDSGNAGGLGVRPDELPDYLLAQGRFPDLSTAIHRTENGAVSDTGCRCPDIDGDFAP
jgi:hypothetical protein